MIEKYIGKNGDDELSHMKNKRSYLRTMGYNRRKNNSYRMFFEKIRNRKQSLKKFIDLKNEKIKSKKIYRLKKLEN